MTSHLSIFAAATPDAPPTVIEDRAGIAAALNERGIRYELFDLPGDLPAAGPEILERLAPLIEDLKARYGYTTADVAAITPDFHDIPAARGKFLEEHTHAEDECRLMLKGAGAFYLHLGDEVLQAVVAEGDLISVPAGTPHWFDMGPKPRFTALRLFTNPEGWVATFTGSPIARSYPAYGE